MLSQSVRLRRVTTVALFFGLLLGASAQESKKETPKEPAVIPAEKWKEVRIENRFKAMLPGEAIEQKQEIGMGMSLRMFMHQVDKNSGFVVGCSEGTSPPERAKLSTEQLLNDSCDGSLLLMKKMDPDCKELSRKDVKIGEFPGKELVIELPKSFGRSVSREYLIHGRLYIVSAMGTGLTESHANVKKFFDSFAPLEKIEGEAKKEK